MAFTYDLTTDRGKTRLRLADTTSTAYVFEDDEVDYFLSVGGSVDAATVEGLKVLLVDRARRAKSFELKGLKLDDTAQIAAIKAAIGTITELDSQLPTLTVSMPALLPMDAGFTEPTT